MAKDNHHSEEHHIMPLATYMKVAAALFALTFLTVGAHHFRGFLGPVAPFIAFGIAAVKAFLVMAWFMHLKYENRENRFVFITGFLCLLLLFAITLTDILSRASVSSVL